MGILVWVVIAVVLLLALWLGGRAVKGGRLSDSHPFEQPTYRDDNEPKYHDDGEWP